MQISKLKICTSSRTIKPIDIVTVSAARANLYRLIDESAVSHQPVFINNYGAGGGVELPFGSVKSSSYGREKGFEALHGFTTLKSVAVKHG